LFFLQKQRAIGDIIRRRDIGETPMTIKAAMARRRSKLSHLTIANIGERARLGEAA
jgi:hypothetical protein